MGSGVPAGTEVSVKRVEMEMILMAVLIPQIRLCPGQADSYMILLHVKQISLFAYSNVG